MTTPNEVRHVLEERARKLARPAAGGAAETAGIEMLTFSVSRERFAIDSHFVFAAFILPDLVPLPGATAPVVGLTRWRGDVLTVTDVRGLVGAATNALDDLGRVIVVGASSPEFGILADSLGDIVRIDTARLYPTTSARSREAQSLLLGVTADAIHVVDVAALIARQTDVRAETDSASSLSSLAPP